MGKYILNSMYLKARWRRADKINPYSDFNMEKVSDDCLIQIISELIKPSSGTKTLTMGTANKAKIADTYVKLLEDDGTGKHPFEVCASTDEGAMTVEAYCNSKNWTLA